MRWDRRDQVGTYRMGWNGSEERWDGMNLNKKGWDEWDRVE